MSDTVYLDGRLVPRAEARVSIDDRAFRYGEGVFDTLRARRDRVFRLDSHLARLRRSAAALSWRLPWSQAELAGAVRTTVDANGHRESRVRIQASRGPGGPDDAAGPPTLLVESVPFVPVPGALREAGVELALSPYRLSAAGAAPSAKSSGYLLNLLARSAARGGGAFEAVLCNEKGEVCEAAMANLFAASGDRLRTPPTRSPALAGVTREVVLELARSRAGLRVSEEPLLPEDLFAADEVFLTSTGLELLAVRGIDGRTIASGAPGRLARSLLRDYRVVLDDELGASR